MKPETLQEEKKKLETKIREIKASLARSLAQGRYFGLDRQVRQVQKSYQLLGRI
ncbi:MAG: hypothetical protein K8R69_00225 [Deltaproteobacteria bacterium]|nr:hypothetical protein [Deltaproteobacteria bacterium]